MQACLPTADAWRPRCRTLEAMALLSVARALVALVPLRLWRTRLGWQADRVRGEVTDRQALWLANHVERAAFRLPLATRCLPRAMALSWMLRRRGIGHSVVFAVRPPALRSGEDALHAWVERSGEVLIGELPGPWMETLRLGD